MKSSIGDQLGSRGDAILRLRLSGNSRYVLPCFLLSVLLHAAIIWGLPSLNRVPLFVRPIPIQVHLELSPSHEIHKPPLKPQIPRKEMARDESHADGVIRTESLSVPDTRQSLSEARQLMDSARSIARDEAVRDERESDSIKKKYSSTPLSTLEEYLRMSHEEIRLANGMTKIVTAIGEVCFQPAPDFARDQTLLYGIPRRCP
ncbi:MAG: hypothetical protein EPO42_05680 [Gallionellaceae bacterium]|nr:MAG: hypothetical protein EPO42_05680 [Gallionellaceae bacterium]